MRHIWEKDEALQDWQDRDSTLQILADYYLFGKDATEYELARKLVKKAELTGPHDIFHLLVKEGVWDKNENIQLLKEEIPTFFSEAAVAEVKDIELPAGADLIAAGRKDFRDLPVFTIDGPATRDYDDGLHLEKQGANYLVGIHISDVGLYIKQGTALFEEALKRAEAYHAAGLNINLINGCKTSEKI